MPTFVLATTSDPGTSTWLDSSFISGGQTVIPDGGTLCGVYTGNVLCEGDVTVTCNIEVEGGLLVRGNFINAGGYEVIVRGDLHAQAINFDKTDQSTPQQDFLVDGDLIFTDMEFRQCDGTAAQLRVGGDLIGSTGFSGSILRGEGVAGVGSTAGTPGLNILVYGDLAVSAVYAYGGNNDSGTAGNGGYVTVYGDCNTGIDLNLSGGDATDGNAGQGGQLYVYGSMAIPDGTLSVRGGDGNNGNAGNGGQIYIEANFSGSEISAYGGQCNSDSENHRAGSGGDIYVHGSVTHCGFMTVSGGDRYGTLTAGNTLSTPDAGTIDVLGGVAAEDIYATGGQVYTDNFAPHNAGNGGSFYCNGYLGVADDFQFEGGYASQGNGGNGGNVSVEGDALIEDDFDMDGGDADNGNGGNGGQAYFYGNLSLDEVRVEGGHGINGNGGNGTYLFVKGDLNVNEFYNGHGGGCNSADETHYAGSGGSIYVEGSFVYYGDDGDLELSGGDRTGATTVANTGGTPANGGNLDVGGNFTSRTTVNLIAGGIFTDYPYAPGGNAGNMYVEGSCYVSDVIYMNGGRSVGGTAGNGGNFEAKGHAGFTSLECDGGQAAASVLGGDAGTAGKAGTVTFRAGVSTGEISQVDGPFDAGGSAPVGDVDLFLTGHCTIGTIDMSARAGTYIRRDLSFANPVVLKVNSFPTKNTLNDIAGAATGDVSASTNGLFITGTGGTWYAIAGVLVP
jgi:hypothetical protein